MGFRNMFFGSGPGPTFEDPDLQADYLRRIGAALSASVGPNGMTGNMAQNLVGAMDQTMALERQQLLDTRNQEIQDLRMEDYMNRGEAQKLREELQLRQYEDEQNEMAGILERAGAIANEMGVAPPQTPEEASLFIDQYIRNQFKDQAPEQPAVRGGTVQLPDGSFGFVREDGSVVPWQDGVEPYHKPQVAPNLNIRTYPSEQGQMIVPVNPKTGALAGDAQLLPGSMPPEQEEPETPDNSEMIKLAHQYRKMYMQIMEMPEGEIRNGKLAELEAMFNWPDGFDPMDPLTWEVQSVGGNIFGDLLE
jgi:hypothetical protein